MFGVPALAGFFVCEKPPKGGTPNNCEHYFFTKTIAEEFVPRGDSMSRWIVKVFRSGERVQASLVEADTSPFGPVNLRDEDKFSLPPSIFAVSVTGICPSAIPVLFLFLSRL